MNKIKVLTKYRPSVDQYENTIVHAANHGITLCGRRVDGFKVREETNYPVDCKRCLAAIAKSK